MTRRFSRHGKREKTKNDPKVAGQLKEMNDLVEMKGRIDEFVIELPMWQSPSVCELFSKTAFD